MKNRRQRVSAIQHDLNFPGIIDLNQAGYLECITHSTLNAIPFQPQINVCEVVACPDDQVMSQLCQENQHLLGRETLFVASHQAVKTLLVTTILRFNATTAAVIGMQSSNVLRLQLFRHRSLTEAEDHGIGQRSRSTHDNSKFRFAFAYAVRVERART